MTGSALAFLFLVAPVADASPAAPTRAQAAIDPAVRESYDHALDAIAAAGRQPTQREARETMASAAAELQKVIAAAPGFAPALAALAEARLMVNLQDRPARREARDLAGRALALSEGEARAHSALGWLLFFEDLRFRDARRAFERALALDPGLHFARFGYGLLLASQGELERGLAEVERAERAPLVRPNWRMGSQSVLFFARRYADAAARALAPLPGAPAVPPDHFWRGIALLAAGDVTEAVRSHEERVREANRNPGSVAALAIAYATAGRDEEARALRPELIGHLQRSEGAGRAACAATPCYLFALADLALGDRAAALEMLERAVRDKPPGVWNVWLRVDPRWDPLRDDPRFRRALAEAGFE